MTHLAVEFAWRPVGSVRVESGRPVFPQFDDVPGLYLFRFEWPDRAAGVYIGESDRLRRRAQHYRTPGVGQATNIRMNHELIEAVSAGGNVSFAIVTEATISLDGRTPMALDLSRKTSRLIVENAAMAAVIAEREANSTSGPVLVNRPGVGEAEWG